MTIISVNPANGAELARFEEYQPDRIDGILAAAIAAQKKWRPVPLAERVKLLISIGAALRGDKKRLATLITREMGKPFRQAEAEIEKCAFNCDFYAEHAPAFLADIPTDAATRRSAVLFEPLGVVLAIMPWNFPFWQFFRFAAPALAAGNGAILKHANNVPQCALAIEDVMREAGCPEGLFRTVLIDSSKVETLIADDRIAAVTLTGSTGVGRLVAAQAGKLLKKQVLELGGSDPFIVLADANLDRAAEIAVQARFNNAGQSCINAKRFILVESIADRFVDLLIANVRKLKLGDPMAEDTTVGPMARGNLRNELHDQVQRTLSAGAQLRLGGHLPEDPGFFYPPTIIDHVRPGMAAFDEETFGPAATIVRAADEEEAITLANRTEYGLGASIWSRDLARAEALARRIDAGSVFINALVASDPRIPFGGIKHSGYGRELSDFGIREFVNIKTLCIDPA